MYRPEHHVASYVEVESQKRNYELHLNALRTMKSCIDTSHPDVPARFQVNNVFKKKDIEKIDNLAKFFAAINTPENLFSKQRTSRSKSATKNSSPYSSKKIKRNKSVYNNILRKKIIAKINNDDNNEDCQTDIVSDLDLISHKKDTDFETHTKKLDSMNDPYDSGSDPNFTSLMDGMIFEDPPRKIYNKMDQVSSSATNGQTNRVRMIFKEHKGTNTSKRGTSERNSMNDLILSASSGRVSSRVDEFSKFNVKYRHDELMAKNVYPRQQESDSMCPTPSTLSTPDEFNIANIVTNTESVNKSKTDTGKIGDVYIPRLDLDVCLNGSIRVSKLDTYMERNNATHMPKLDTNFDNNTDTHVTRSDISVKKNKITRSLRLSTDVNKNDTAFVPKLDLSMNKKSGTIRSIQSCDLGPETTAKDELSHVGRSSSKTVDREKLSQVPELVGKQRNQPNTLQSSLPGSWIGNAPGWEATPMSPDGESASHVSPISDTHLRNSSHNIRKKAQKDSKKSNNNGNDKRQAKFSNHKVSLTSDKASTAGKKSHEKSNVPLSKITSNECNGENVSEALCIRNISESSSPIGTTDDSQAKMKNKKVKKYRKVRKSKELKQLETPKVETNDTKSMDVTDKESVKNLTPPINLNAKGSGPSSILKSSYSNVESVSCSSGGQTIIGFMTPKDTVPATPDSVLDANELSPETESVEVCDKRKVNCEMKSVKFSNQILGVCHPNEQKVTSESVELSECNEVNDSHGENQQDKGIFDTSGSPPINLNSHTKDANGLNKHESNKKYKESDNMTKPIDCSEPDIDRQHNNRNKSGKPVVTGKSKNKQKGKRLSGCTNSENTGVNNASTDKGKSPSQNSVNLTNNQQNEDSITDSCDGKKAENSLEISAKDESNIKELPDNTNKESTDVGSTSKGKDEILVDKQCADKERVMSEPKEIGDHCKAENTSEKGPGNSGVDTSKAISTDNVSCEAVAASSENINGADVVDLHKNISDYSPEKVVAVDTRDAVEKLSPRTDKDSTGNTQENDRDNYADKSSNISTSCTNDNTCNGSSNKNDESSNNLKLAVMDEQGKETDDIKTNESREQIDTDIDQNMGERCDTTRAKKTARVRFQLNLDESRVVNKDDVCEKSNRTEGDATETNDSVRSDDSHVNSTNVNDSYENRSSDKVGSELEEEAVHNASSCINDNISPEIREGKEESIPLGDPECYKSAESVRPPSSVEPLQGEKSCVDSTNNISVNSLGSNQSSLSGTNIDNKETDFPTESINNDQTSVMRDNDLVEGSVDQSDHENILVQQSDVHHDNSKVQKDSSRSQLDEATIQATDSQHETASVQISGDKQDCSSKADIDPVHAQEIPTKVDDGLVQTSNLSDTSMLERENIVMQKVTAPDESALDDGTEKDAELGNMSLVKESKETTDNNITTPSNDVSGSASPTNEELVNPDDESTHVVNDVSSLPVKSTASTPMEGENISGSSSVNKDVLKKVKPLLKIVPDSNSSSKSSRIIVRYRDLSDTLTITDKTKGHSLYKSASEPVLDLLERRQSKKDINGDKASLTVEEVNMNHLTDPSLDNPDDNIKMHLPDDPLNKTNEPTSSSSRSKSGDVNDSNNRSIDDLSHNKENEIYQSHESKDNSKDAIVVNEISTVNVDADKDTLISKEEETRVLDGNESNNVVSSNLSADHVQESIENDQATQEKNCTNDESNVVTTNKRQLCEMPSGIREEPGSKLASLDNESSEISSANRSEASPANDKKHDMTISRYADNSCLSNENEEDKIQDNNSSQNMFSPKNSGKMDNAHEIEMGRENVNTLEKAECVTDTKEHDNYDSKNSKANNAEHEETFESAERVSGASDNLNKRMSSENHKPEQMTGESPEDDKMLTKVATHGEGINNDGVSPIKQLSHKFNSQITGNITEDVNESKSRDKDCISVRSPANQSLKNGSLLILSNKEHTIVESHTSQHLKPRKRISFDFDSMNIKGSNHSPLVTQVECNNENMYNNYATLAPRSLHGRFSSEAAQKMDKLHVLEASPKNILNHRLVESPTNLQKSSNDRNSPSRHLLVSQQISFQTSPNRSELRISDMDISRGSSVLNFCSVNTSVACASKKASGGISVSPGKRVKKRKKVKVHKGQMMNPNYFSEALNNSSIKTLQAHNSGNRLGLVMSRDELLKQFEDGDYSFFDTERARSARSTNKQSDNIYSGSDAYNIYKPSVRWV